MLLDRFQNSSISGKVRGFSVPQWQGSGFVTDDLSVESGILLFESCWTPDQVINYREVPLSDFVATSQYRRGPRSLPPLWSHELIGSVRRRTISVWLNRSGGESDNLPPSSDEVKNACSYASTNPLVFVMWWIEDGVKMDDISVPACLPSVQSPSAPPSYALAFLLPSGTRTTIVRTSYGEIKLSLWIFL
jgi:hypothetical protein